MALYALSNNTERALTCTPDGALHVAATIIGGFPIPSYKTIELTYYGTTNNIHQVIYKDGGTVVATQTLTYENNLTDGSRLIQISLT